MIAAIELLSTWRVGNDTIEELAKQEGGGSRPDAAPRGKRLTELTKWAYTGGKKSNSGDGDDDDEKEE